ncbi:MAG: OprO/OprP family phosphate-selective porin [Bacteroidales bacterium]|nr:OprO/OprP family phosphate-selective porin [Bacteroidales bacterium]
MKNLITIITLLFLLAPAASMAQGCMEATSDEGVSVVGYIQPQWTFDEANGDNENTFHFNRARIGFVGSIPYDFSYYVMAELSPTKNGPYLLDAFITWKRLGPYANITVGQFKSPFGLELSTPCQSLHTINRSLVVSELASPFRDLGVMIYGGTNFGKGDTDILNWKLAFTNGKGMNNLDNNKFKDIVARLIITPFKDIKIGGSYKYGKVLNPGIDNKLTRFGGDISIEKYNFLVQAEYIGGTDDGFKLEGGGCGQDPTIMPFDGKINKQGFFVMVLYKTPWELQPVVKYGNYDSDSDLPNTMKNTYTYGINYFFNDWTRLQINYVVNDYIGIDLPNNLFIVQLQAKF